MSLRSWERAGKRGLTRALGKALAPRTKAGGLPDFADLESILLIRQQNQLGDVLLSTPAVRAIRRRAPNARIDFVAGPQNLDAIRGNRHLDEVLVYDKLAYWRRPLAGKRWTDRLRRARYDLVLVMSTVSFSYTSAWLAALAGARWRAGRPAPRGGGRETASDLYHWVLDPPVAGRHQSAVNLDLVSPFGADDEDLTPEIHLTADEDSAGEELLEAALGPPDGSLRVVVHPGAGKKPNRWPADRFGDVAAALAASGHRVAVATGPGEEDLFARVDAGAAGRLPRLASAPVRHFAGAVRAADFLLANDTGVLHVGAAVGVPVLALFGPTNPDEWCPKAPGVEWLRAPTGDLARLETDPVRRRALEIAASIAEKRS